VELPESVARVGAADVFPNEYPGQNYAFNWCLNGDGVTPLKKASFRIMKPLDLKLAGLPVPQQIPLKVTPVKEGIPEAGSDQLSFDLFDETTLKIKDSLSHSDKLFCPEGHAPGTRIGVRVITNSANLAPRLLAYLERAPKTDPVSLPITCYVFQKDDAAQFAGFAIEIVEEDGVSKSVAAVVISGNAPTVEQVVAGIQLSVEGITADENNDASSAQN